MKTKKILLSAITMLATVPSFGSSIFYWDNQTGLSQTSDCVLIKNHKSRFRISSFSGSQAQNYENIRDHAGNKRGKLAINSIVKAIEGTKKKDYEKIEIAGINSSKSKSLSPASSRSDQGYIYSQSVKPIHNFLIETGSGSEKLKNGYLKAVVDGNNELMSVGCRELDPLRDYTLFSFHPKGSYDAPPFLVAIYWDETAIFKDIKVSHIDEHSAKEDLMRSIQADISLPSIDKVVDFHFKDGHIAPTNLPASAPAPSIIDSHLFYTCQEGGTVNVRDNSLETVLFAAAFGEQVKIFQGWGENQKTKEFSSGAVDFVKVQFVGRESRDQRTGWIAKDYIKTRTQCPRLRNGAPSKMSSSTSISGLSDKKCCNFPVTRPNYGGYYYMEGQRRFAWNRARGRKHAANDLARPHRDPVEAVAKGKVIESLRPFYLGSYVMAVKHEGGFVARYGEIRNKSMGLRYGSYVKPGQKIGEIHHIRAKGCCSYPMLHFELYKGNASGTLRSRSSYYPYLKSSGHQNYKFQRRRDLLHPSPHLRKWEKMKFGKTYK